MQTPFFITIISVVVDPTSTAIALFTFVSRNFAVANQFADDIDSGLIFSLSLKKNGS